MKVIFTDPDGTLLDQKTYSFQPAEESLNLIKEKNIPLVICSSKTRAEIEFWRKKLENDHPFISENGGGIFIPKNYFSFELSYDREDKNYFIIQLGIDYHKLIEVLKKIEKNFAVRGFNQMSVREITKDSGLPLKQALMAKKREFDEPFIILKESHRKKVLKGIKKAGLTYTVGGRYHHLLGKNDKGKACRILKSLYMKEYEKVVIIAIGDSENDFPMLNQADRAYLVMKDDRTYATKKYKKAGAPGPAGWNEAIKKELSKNN
ncbi:MAG: HAD-IIB family hydrolase [Candidatus Aminicenantales bacterium]